MASFYNVGNMTVCGQALAIVVTALLLYVAMILMDPSLPTFILATINFILLLVNAYAVNCMVVGKCEIFAWVMSALAVLSIGLAVIAILVSGKIPDQLFKRARAVEKLATRGVKTVTSRK